MAKTQRRKMQETSSDAAPRILRDRLALERTKLANERTFLAYVRTALALLAAGVGLIHLLEGPLYEGLGWVFNVLAGITLTWGVRRFLRVRAALHARG